MQDTIKLADKKHTLMVAHRGVSGLEQENTIPSFVAACNRSYFGAECDVHVTKDGKYIVHHDDNTSRICDKALDIEESYFSDIRALRVKSFGSEQYDGTLILPTLEEYLNVLSRYGKTAVIELKCPMDPENIREIIGICKTCYSLDKIIFISFFFDNLLAVRKILPQQKLQFLTGECPEETLQMLINHSVDLDIVFPALTKPLIDKLHSHGILINCWTCDDKNEAEKLIGWGVDYITTNILE